jgi:hypothetical protein
VIKIPKDPKVGYNKSHYHFRQNDKPDSVFNCTKETNSQKPFLAKNLIMIQTLLCVKGALDYEVWHIHIST